MELTPLGDRLVVELIEEEKVTPTGLYISAPSEDYSAPAKGLVRAISTSDRDIEVKVGDTVMFPRYSGIEITINNEDLILLEFDNVLVKVL